MMRLILALAAYERVVITAAICAALVVGYWLAYFVQWARDAWKERRERRFVTEHIRNHKPRARLNRQQRRVQARQVAKQFANYTFGGKVEGAE